MRQDVTKQLLIELMYHSRNAELANAMFELIGKTYEITLCQMKVEN